MADPSDSGTTVAGGLRSRLIFDSLYQTVQQGLTGLGWFQSVRSHRPVRLSQEQEDISTPVAVNTLAISDENVSSQPWEIGSILSQDTRYYYLDFFGESDAVSKHLIGDVRDILLGKLPQIGRSGPTLYVYDYRQPTPPVIFSCDIITVTVMRSHTYEHPWLRHWYTIQATLYDYYNNSADGGPYGT